MSYTRRFSKTVTIRYSGSVSYPASQNGGSVSYSGTAHEKVNFDVTVDTEPFDDAIVEMKGDIDQLTASVVATETAQIESIDSTSRQIGNTIVEGFFKTVRSDISQQITALTIQSESLLLQLSKLAERCREKQTQMGTDYRRLSERYLKVFEDLNKELENRVYSIDEPIFRAGRSLNEIGDHKGNESSPATVSVTAGETAHLHSVLAANHTKRSALEAVEKGKRFLSIQYASDDVVNRCLLKGDASGMIHTPYCVVETTTPDGGCSRELYASPLLKNISGQTLDNKINDKGWTAQMPEDDVRRINDYFKHSVAAQQAAATDPHSRRVADMTARLFDLSHTATTSK